MRRLSILLAISVISASSISLSTTTTTTPIENVWTVQKIDSNDKNVKIPLGGKKIHFVRHAQGYHNVAGETDPIFGYLREDLEVSIYIYSSMFMYYYYYNLGCFVNRFR